MVNGSATHVVVGCGYVGKRLLRQLPDGACGLGVGRTQAASFDHWLTVDLDKDNLQALTTAVHGAVLFYFAPPSAHSLQDDRSRRLLSALEQSVHRPEAIVLISTTGVYGDCSGRWVHENEQLNPGVERSVRRVDAEQAWTDYADRSEIPLAVLRVAGIYGPDKLPIARLQKDQPLLSEAQSPYSNRVHVDDLVAAALAAAGAPLVVNVADGAPSTMTAYFHALADALGVPRLPEAEREVLATLWSAGMSSYMQESRRIDNSRLRELLGGDLKYPDLAAGLAACIEPI